MAKTIKVELRSLRKGLDNRIKTLEKSLATGQRSARRARKAKDTVSAKATVRSLAQAKKALANLRKAQRLVAASCCNIQIQNCEFRFDY
jgi:hypothetical protein